MFQPECGKYTPIPKFTMQALKIEKNPVTFLYLPIYDCYRESWYKIRKEDTQFDIDLKMENVQDCHERLIECLLCMPAVDMLADKGPEWAGASRMRSCLLDMKETVNNVYGDVLARAEDMFNLYPYELYELGRAHKDLWEALQRISSLVKKCETPSSSN